MNAQGASSAPFDKTPRKDNAKKASSRSRKRDTSHAHSYKPTHTHTQTHTDSISKTPHEYEGFGDYAMFQCYVAVRGESQLRSQGGP